MLGLVKPKQKNYSYQFTSRHTLPSKFNMEELFRLGKRHQAIHRDLINKIKSHIRIELQSNRTFTVLGVYIDAIRYPLPNVQEVSFELIISSKKDIASLSRTMSNTYISCGSVVAQTVSHYKHVNYIRFTQDQFNQLLTNIY